MDFENSSRKTVNNAWLLCGSCGNATSPVACHTGRDTSSRDTSRMLVPGARLANNADIVLGYRHIYKALLRAVQYSKPARFVAQERVRNAFREGNREDYDALKISRTIEMLDTAAKARGLEHKIVKNLMHAWWEQKKLLKSPILQPKERHSILSAYKDFDRTIESLNATMGLCIK